MSSTQRSPALAGQAREALLTDQDELRPKAELLCSAPAVGTVTAATLLVLGIWAADRAEHFFGRKDDGRIVIDEVVGQLLALAPLLFFTNLAGATWLALLGAGFLLFRLFDIWKPGPVAWAERHFAGGAGVMLDDVVAGVFAALVMTPLAIFCSARIANA